MNAIRPRVVWQFDAALGEGPVWLPSEQALRFVDIKRGRTHRFDFATGRGETSETGGAPSFIVPAADGGLLVGSHNTIHRLEGGRLGEVVAQIPEPVTNRTNDATVDEAGRLWFGTMDDRERDPSGAIWCLDRGVLYRAGPQAVITNGPAVSLRDRWLYHVDTGERTIRRAPLDGSPNIPNGEVFVRLDEGGGYPDGIVVDSEDCLWVGLWDGWGVRRYSPDGELLLHVEFPCARVTKIAFGGTDLRTAYATTARVGLSEEELLRQPLASSLFAFEAPVAGRPVPSVQLA